MGSSFGGEGCLVTVDIALGLGSGSTSGIGCFLISSVSEKCETLRAGLGVEGVFTSSVVVSSVASNLGEGEGINLGVVGTVGVGVLTGDVFLTNDSRIFANGGAEGRVGGGVSSDGSLSRDR